MIKHNEQRYHLVPIRDEEDLLFFEIWDIAMGFDTVFESVSLSEAVNEWCRLNKLKKSHNWFRRRL